MDTEILNFGIAGVALLLIIKELFAFLKTKKDNGNDKTNTQLLDSLQLIESNHLNSIEKTIGEGNDKIVKAINDIGIKQIEILCDIRGKLNK